MMTDQESEYFDWLYTMAVGNDGSYTNLLKDLYELKFNWTIYFDKNRAADGIALRRSFVFETAGLSVHDSWLGKDCSFLEMMVALAEKMAMLLDKSIPSTFKHLLRNSGLAPMTNNNYDEVVVNHIVGTITDRSYQPNGTGGFFPIRNSDKDQRTVELLYQMNSYILENGW